MRKCGRACAVNEKRVGNHQVRKPGQDHNAGQFHIGAIATKWVILEVGVHVLESIGLFHENSEGCFSNSQSHQKPNHPVLQ